MDCLEKLQQIGIKKINQETRISVGVLENILEKRFDKIQRVWVVGFLPILERQYGYESYKIGYLCNFYMVIINVIIKTGKLQL